MSTKIKFETTKDILTFMFLGQAFLTIKSLKTNTHFTFRITSSRKSGNTHFVWVKSISNTFSYLGVVKNRNRFELTPSSTFNSRSMPYIAFKYLLGVALTKEAIPPLLEVCHTGRCGRCGRWISTPNSIDRGIGPECYKILGFQGMV
jgi:hypothetical protein